MGSRRKLPGIENPHSHIQLEKPNSEFPFKLPPRKKTQTHSTKSQIKYHRETAYCSKMSHQETNQSEWERTEHTAYCRIQILRKKPCVISGHKRNNTIPGQRRRNRKRRFPIWHLRTLVKGVSESTRNTRFVNASGGSGGSSGCSEKRASSGMRGDKRGGGSGGGRKCAGGRRHAGEWRHNEGEESISAMEGSNRLNGKKTEQANKSCRGDPWRRLS
ncbi:hypothetical protein HID58_061625 [Brassica napus]|uniref:Uncharacterized protein n=1 Tax=Brassica napus TaxID=3708 RepID=A0ABQ7ZZ43_BRANA|nr:hypothetical protein HID58_061625 [Brassica napus]